MKVLFVPVKWSDSTEPIDGGSWNVAFVQDLANKTRAYYLENSFGKVAMDITVSPWLTIAVANAQATLGAVMAGANVELLKIGIDQSQFERVVAFCPVTKANGYKGLNSGRNSVVWNCNGSEYGAHSTLHELGHSFGASHPNVLQGVASRSGSVITMPPLSVVTGGTIRGLYDASTIMGYDFWSPHFSGPEKAALGWVTPTVHLGGDVTYSLTPLATAGGSCYVVKVPMTTYSSASHRVYWIERREDVGQGYWFKIPTELRGVIIRVQGDFNCYSASRIDTAPGRPGDGRSYTSNLLPGESFTDGALTIDCVSDGVVRIHDSGVVVVPPPVVYPPAGTLLGTLCRGVDQYGRYANGTGGETTALIQANSPSCGYVPPVNPNVATLAALQPAVAALIVGQITQAKIDAVRTLDDALKADA